MIRRPDTESDPTPAPATSRRRPRPAPRRRPRPTPRRRPRPRFRWQRPAVGPLARSFAFVIVSLRYVIVAGWLVAAVLAVLFLPSLSAGSGIGDLVPNGSPALRAEADATRLFRVPMSAPVAVVQHSQLRLPAAVQDKAGRSALAVDRGTAQPIPGLAGALPVANTSGLFPGSRQSSTTVITFLYFRPATSMAAQVSGGETYAQRYAGAPRDHLAGVTGPVPARYEQGQIIQHYLPWVEAATVLAIFLIVGWHFRSLGAPLATLACAGASYLVAVHLVAWVAQRMGVTIPPDLEPVLVVLLLGVTTDYCVFYLSGMRAQLAEGKPRIAAARHTTAEYTPIIVAAGVVVAAGTAALVVARITLLRAFGPGLALTVLTAMVVAVTLAPALIAIFGGLLFKPGPRRLRRAKLSREGTDAPAAGRRRWLPGGARLADGAANYGAANYGAANYGAANFRAANYGAANFRAANYGARFAATRPVALLIVLGCLAGLLIAAFGASRMRLGSPIIRELPASVQAARAETAASRGFVPGIMAPVDVLMFGPGVGSQPGKLGRLQRELRHQPGVAGVAGPANLPAAAGSLHLMVTASGNAARYALIERTDPFGPAAVSRVSALQRRLPALARSAGLTGVRFEVGGETALTAESIDATTADMARIAVAVLAVTLLLLAIFLRAVLAPLYLLAASVLALLAALGVTVWIFQGALGYDGLVYFVPFAAAVLLVSLGSDYNIFVVGRIFQEARRRPVREAVATAAPKASQAITTAGVALAASFAVLAVIPLDQFRELAVAMALGIVIDAFVVRSLMVPALVALFGRAGRWPGGRGAP